MSPNSFLSTHYVLPEAITTIGNFVSSEVMERKAVNVALTLPSIAIGT
jgi:hypothetical protein